MVKKTKEVLSVKLKETLDTINKDFGDGAIMKLGDRPNTKIKKITTGSLKLDIALGGGMPYGRIIEIYGNEGTGKTTISSHIIAEIQKTGGKAAIIDAEFAFDTVYAKNLGINVEDLYISQPSCSEEGLEILDRLIESGEFDIIVIDSVAALVPRKELDGEAGDSVLGVQARLMSQALRKITGKISKTNTLVIFINQIREKIGVMFGSNQTTTGGRALGFYASVRLDISRMNVLKDGDESVGNHIKIKVVKNKVAPPFKTAECDIIFGEGLDNVGEIVDLSIALQIAQKSGSWYSYNGEKIGQGREAVKTLLKDNQELFEEIKEKVVSKINS